MVVIVLLAWLLSMVIPRARASRTVYTTARRTLSILAEMCNEGVTALNELYGLGGLPCRMNSDVQPPAGQLHFLERISSASRRVGQPPDLSAAGAFQELRGSRAGYTDTVRTGGLPTPYVEGNVSLPPCGSTPADLDLPRWP